MAITDTGAVLKEMGLSAADLREQAQAAKDEILSYIRGKWPEAQWDELSSRNDIYGTLRAVRQERICASCLESGDPLCDGRRSVGIILRQESARGCSYAPYVRPCPRAQAEKAKVTPFDRLVAHSRLCEKQRSQTFDAFNLEGVNRDVRRAYFMALGAASDGAWLALGGRRGAGKSHLAAAIALETMRKGQQAYFRLVPEMLDDLRRGYEDGDHDAQMGFLKKVPCLILDDLGKERGTSAAHDYLHQIIDSRYRHGLQVIVTTNAASKEELAGWDEASFLAPIISRMDEMGDWVFITNAEDYRERKGRERRAKTGKAVA